MRSNVIRWGLGAAFMLIVGVVVVFGMRSLTGGGHVGRIVLATGGGDGSYHDLIRTYGQELARNGVRLELREQVEGADALKEMLDDKSPIQGGVLKGGFMGSLTGRLASAKARDRHEREANKLRSIGRLFLEPVWVFTRAGLPIESLRDLKGKRILTGLRQSGARRVAIQLLRANGVNNENSVLADEQLTEDGRALVTGEADAAFVVLAPDSQRIQKLLRVPGIRLMNFAPEIDAYTSRFPALSKAVMHRGSVEFEPVIPSADITLLATSAVLVVRQNVDPAVVSLLTYAVVHHPKSGFDRAGDPVLFHRAGEFPSSHDPEFDVLDSARQVHKSGEAPMLLRILAPLNERLGVPFSVTSLMHAHGAKLVLLIPLLAIILPLMRAVPALYAWSVRRRLIYWYRQLKALEAGVDSGGKRYDLPALQAAIERIDVAVRKIRVPLYYSGELYDLRGHIDLVRQQLSTRRGPIRIAAE